MNKDLVLSLMTKAITLYDAARQGPPSAEHRRLFASFVVELVANKDELEDVYDKGMELVGRICVIWNVDVTLIENDL